MARGRMINKKICNSRVINDLPEPAQLLYTWLIPHLDCNGCFYGSAQMVKSLVFPRKNYSKTRIENWLKALENANGTEKSPLIVRYFVDGEQYLFMPGFEGEQIGLRKDKERPDFPTFDGKHTESVGQTVPLREGEGEGKGTEQEKNITSSSLLTEDAKEVFQRNLGDLSDDMETEVSLACIKFSPEWVIEAISEAVKHDKRTWAYVAGVLKNWQRCGKNGKPKNKDPDKYLKGKYGHRVQR